MPSKTKAKYVGFVTAPTLTCNRVVKITRNGIELRYYFMWGNIALSNLVLLSGCIITELESVGFLTQTDEIYLNHNLAGLYCYVSKRMDPTLVDAKVTALQALHFRQL